jgi:branched-chain amino acid transport system ATP-binding protein
VLDAEAARAPSTPAPAAPDLSAPAASRPAGPDALLAVRGLEAGYGGNPVLFGVDLDVAAGDVVAILGPNGAGKTTLLRAIAGLIGVRRGTVRLAGVDVTHADTANRVALGLGCMLGGEAVFPSLSVLDNLLVGCHRFAWDVARVGERVAFAIGLFPRLGERFDQPAGTLSGGEQQMLGLAKALLPEPALLLIDELSLGLAPAVVAQLIEVVGELRAGGTTIVVVEQSADVAATVADRTVWIEKGAVSGSAGISG